MKLAGLLNQETVQNAFLIGLLLTGSMKQAEDAVMESVDCSDASDLSGERIFRRVIDSLCSTFTRPAWDIFDDDSAAVLPPELRRVLNLPRELRACFVLRLLIGLPCESCARLLQVDPSEIGSRLQRAITKLAGFCGNDPDAAQRKVGVEAEIYA
jgi:hypothetical protein